MTKPTSTPWATYLGSAIGRYTESEGGDSLETQEARANLFDVYDEWCQAGRPILGGVDRADLRVGDDELDRSEREGRR
jgi:hypothetical protein